MHEEKGRLYHLHEIEKVTDAQSTGILKAWIDNIPLLVV